jgi:hypothetical protein
MDPGHRAGRVKRHQEDLNSRPRAAGILSDLTTALKNIPEKLRRRKLGEIGNAKV